jgi:deoxycytidine triphosphate deaminase
MYLSNTELNSLLPEMEISGTDIRYPFEPIKQIQLCTIDLRVSNIFWRQKRESLIIDLGQNEFNKISPRRGWKRIEIEFGESIIIKPNELIIGRTYEQFKIPKRYAGKIVAKSSVARLGISLFCSTDFINPGWVGHIPLIIKNHGINSVKIHPLLTMCQIMVIELSSVPIGEYGEGQYRSSYQNDDGGPSFWWRDQMFENIRSSHEDITETTMNELITRFENIDDDGLLRFEKYLSSKSYTNISNSTDIIYSFSKQEKRKSKIQIVLKGVYGMLQAALLTTSIKLIFDISYTSIHYCFWLFTIFTLPVTIWFVFLRDEKKYYYNI